MSSWPRQTTGHVAIGNCSSGTSPDVSNPFCYAMVMPWLCHGYAMVMVGSSSDRLDTNGRTTLRPQLLVRRPHRR